MSEPCSLTTKNGIADWCDFHDMYHHGHLRKYALGTDPKSLTYRKMWDERVHKKTPSFLSKLGHYTGSTIRHVLSGFQVAPQDIQDERARICSTCEHNQNNACTQCGCPLTKTLIGDKLARATESCPIDKWAAWKPSAFNFWLRIFRDMVVDDGWPQNWWAQLEVQLSFRRAMLEKIRELNTFAAFPAEKYQGRGVVILGGGAKYGTGVYISCRMLRHHGWTGPIQVWHRGDEEPLPAEIFQELGVDLVDAIQFRESHPCRRWGMDRWDDPHNRWLSWGLKSYALLHCPFREVLYLDADAYPVAPVDPLFESNTSGTLIWYDLPGMESNLRWDVYGIPHDGGPGWQGGQYLIDKSKAWNALQLYRWLDDWSDFTYRYGYGDQDNLRLAWAATKTPHHAFTHRGQEVYTQPFFGCLRAWDQLGKFVIQHRITDKLFQRNFWTEAGHVPGTGKRLRWYDEDIVHGFANEYRQACRGLQPDLPVGALERREME